jgi:AcrR family transcriptional regulator
MVPVPRVAEARQAAEPASPNQQARHARILRAAAVLGAQHGLDGVQMHEVAREAGVAIATLYRYFPSKTHLFTSVMAAQLDRLAEDARPSRTGDRVSAVAEVLVRATRRLVASPALAQAMIQSNNAAQAETVMDSVRIEATFRQLLLTILQVEDPSADDLTMVRLVSVCWYGLLTQALNGHSSLAEVESDIEVACRLLLAPRYPGTAESDRPKVVR